MKERSPTLSCFLLSYDDRPPSVQTSTFDRPNFSLSFSSKGLSVVVSATCYLASPMDLLPRSGFSRSSRMPRRSTYLVEVGRLAVFVAVTLLNELYQIFLIRILKCQTNGVASLYPAVVCHCLLKNANLFYLKKNVCWSVFLIDKISYLGNVQVSVVGRIWSGLRRSPSRVTIETLKL